MSARRKLTEWWARFKHNYTTRFIPKLKKSIPKQNTLPIIIIALVVFFCLYHVLSYIWPFTDNAFVVTNVTPVAADVSGFITDIYVKNGEYVKKNQAIFTVYSKPYELAYQKAHADYLAGLQKIHIFEKKIQQTQSELESINAQLEKTTYEWRLKHGKLVKEAVSTLEIKKLTYDMNQLAHTRLALQHKVEVIHAEILQQKHIISSLEAKEGIAKINLDLTTVRAPADGLIDNLYVASNTPIKIHQPIFSFIDTSNFYIQANFNETDLRRVRPGDKAYIMLRMYYFDKIFHGVIVNNLWAAERQKTAKKSQLQIVSNENEWLLLPQRFPVQIKIVDPSPDYPLNPGASAYVYISTKK